ncbi:MAG: DUF4424 family protein [Candidatus Kapabacteria bacterium]|nr:DUF4424 family protein [Candidatus Kapabacteria bacterium]
MVVFFVLLLTVCTAWCNDSSFEASGSTLLPLRDSSIRMVREDLRVTIRGREARIDVDYVFVNDGPAKTITVGFVTPPAYGDIAERLQSKPQIRGFVVVFNGTRQSWEIRKVTDSERAQNLHLYSGDWVYLFEATFPNGRSHVKHSYRFNAGSSVDAPIRVPYRLTTGTHWKSGVIDTFRLTVDVGKGRLVAVPSTFTGDTSHQLPWISTGMASIADSVGYNFFYDDEPPQPNTAWAVSDGVLVLEQLSFGPTQDLMVTIHNGMSLCERAQSSPDKQWIFGLSCIELAEMKKWIESMLHYAAGSHDEEYDEDRALLELVRNALKASHCR